MVSLQVFKDSYSYPIYDIKLVNKINIIMGMSGTSKTYLFEVLKNTIRKDEYDVTWRHQCNKEIILIDTVDEFDEKIETISDNLIIMDEDIVEILRRKNRLGEIVKSNNYFLLLDRALIIKICTYDTFEFKSRIFDRNKVFDLVKVDKTSSTRNII